MTFFEHRPKLMAGVRLGIVQMCGKEVFIIGKAKKTAGKTVILIPQSFCFPAKNVSFSNSVARMVGMAVAVGAVLRHFHCQTQGEPVLPGKGHGISGLARGNVLVVGADDGETLKVYLHHQRLGVVF